jgi:outer membrane protein OmpA-like peptidoglycan-associated protein
MTQTLRQELDEYRRTLDSIRKLYEDDETISRDDQDYLKALSDKVQKLLLEDEENASMSAFGGGGVSAAPLKTPAPLKQPTPKAKATPAPEYKKTGLAEFMPAFNNPTAGLRLWNFLDGSETPDANQQRALKSQFFKSLEESQKSYEIIGYASGIGLDRAGGVGLSTKRARAVRDFLVKNGIKKEKFVRTYGKGSSSPLANDMKDGKPWAEGAAWNRRVDIMPTENNMVVPDNVVDDMGDVGEVTGGSGGDPGNPDIRGKLPEGKSGGTAKWLTISGVSVETVASVIELMFWETAGATAAGSVAAIIAPAILLMKVADAWRQAQQEANRRGMAYGFKLGAYAAVEVIRGGNNRVTAEQLWNMSKSKAKQFGNRRIPIEWWEVERDISIGVQQSADVVNKAMELTESELLKLLNSKFGGKNGKAIHDANIKMVRGVMAQKLADSIAKEVDRVLGG